MDFSKLQPGMVVKNYKELCDLIGEEVKSGCAKKVQMEKIGHYVNFHKDKYAFVIDSVKTVDEKYIKNRERFVYNLHVQKIVMDMLANHYVSTGSTTLELISSEFLENLGLINQNYSTGRNKIKPLAHHMEVGTLDLHQFFSNSYTRFKTIMNSGLSQLRSKRIIDSMDAIKVIYKQDVPIDSWGSTTVELVRDATEEEVKLFLEIEKQTLNEMGLSNMRQLFLKNKHIEFYSIVGTKIQSATQGKIVGKYRVKKIFFCEDIKKSKEELDMMLLGEKRSLEMLTLNKKICNSVISENDMKLYNVLVDINAPILDFNQIEKDFSHLLK